MSNIQTLIETIQAESLETRSLMVAEQTWQEYMVDCLLEIKDSIVELKEGMFQYFADEQDRFDQAQEGLKAARRAELERLKESGGRGFATPAKKSDGTVAEAPVQEGGSLLAGLGITGLLAGIGAAVSGYAVGIISNLIKVITLGKFDGPKIIGGITKALKAIPNAIRSFALGSIMQIQLFLDKLPKPSMPQGLVNAGKAITAFFTENKIGKVLTKVGSVLKTIGASIASTFNIRPIMDAVKAIRGGQGGGVLSKIGSMFGRLGSLFGKVFTLASKIAVPITAIIATVKAIFSSFKEFGDDMGFFEKLMITVKNLFKEIVSGFVTMPLELIKDGISTIAGWLGFDGVEKYLDSFDIDKMFRDSVDSIFNWLKEAIKYVGDLVYQGLQAIGIGDVDPEAEARITARKASSAEENLAEADARVQRLEETIATSPPGRARNNALRQLKNAKDQRDMRAKDLQEAQAGPAPSLLADEDSGQLNAIDTRVVPLTSVDKMTSDEAAKRVLKEVTTPVLSSPVEQNLTSNVENNESLATNQSMVNNESLATSAMIGGLSSVIEGASTFNQSTGDLTNNILGDRSSALALSAMTTSLANVVGSSDAITNQSTGSSITGDNISSSVTPSPGLGTAPVAMASKQVDAAKSQPQVVAISGGSSQSVQNNVMNQQTVNMGARSARSQDLGVQRLKDQSMA